MSTGERENEKFLVQENLSSVGLRFNRWQRGVDFLMMTKNVMNSQRRLTWLLHCAEQEMLDINDILTYFSLTVNVPYERHVYHSVNQKVDENQVRSVENY